MMTEEAIYNSLTKNFTFGGVEFFDIERNKKKFRKNVNLRGEFDMVMINGTTIAIIETKYRVRAKDVTNLFEKKLPDFKILCPEYGNLKIILGIGGMCFEEDSEQIAKNNGIGILKVVGDNVEYYTDNLKIY